MGVRKEFKLPQTLKIQIPNKQLILGIPTSKKELFQLQVTWIRLAFLFWVFVGYYIKLLTVTSDTRF